MLKGFRDFILRGNILELAVAVVIGTAFVALITQFTESFITPLVAVSPGAGMGAASSSSAVRRSATGRSSALSSPS